MDLFLSSVGFGVLTAAVLVLAALGFTLQFSVTNIFNIALGSQMTLAAFVGYLINKAGANIWLAVALAGIFGAASSVALNRFLYTPFLRRGTTFFGMVVVTIAVDLILAFGAQGLFGPDNFQYRMSGGHVYHLGPIQYSTAQLVIIGIGITAMFVVHAVLRYTRLGKAMRATSTNSLLARGCGIPTERVTDLAWALSGLLVGVAGVTLGISLGGFSSTMGDSFLLTIVAAAVLGGIGQPYGAMLGALVIGLVSQMSSLVLPSAYSEVSAFVILLLVLLVRPSGIMAGAARVKGIAA